MSNKRLYLLIGSYIIILDDIVAKPIVFHVFDENFG